ncbi:MAG TPA: molybdopterin molybdenumtransferase MoeA, partial [Aigarchaeota archaeon]|nr:molybdopterin molybdenumtransferase MoeA [Aigarchaeota archaeon]
MISFVRMLRRVERFIPVDEALELLLRHVDFLGAEEIEASKALGRVLAEDIHADGDYPPYDASHMDGFALNHRDTVRASPENPVKLKVIGHVTAGKRPEPRLKPGSALRILTGAYLPEGADCVVPQEEVETIDGGYIMVKRPVKPGENIDPAAGDVKRGELVLKRGRVLKPIDVAFLHHLRRWRVKVAKRP